MLGTTTLRLRGCRPGLRGGSGTYPSAIEARQGTSENELHESRTWNPKRSGEAKVSELELVVGLVHQQVLRLQVAMQDSARPSRGVFSRLRLMRNPCFDL